jgi:hypothetical protein
MSEPITTADAPPKAGLWEDFIDIFYQPAQVFERRRDGKFAMALIAFWVLSVVLFFALRNGLAPIFDAEIAKATAAAAAKNPQMSSDQLASMQNTMEKFGTIGFMIFLPIGIFIAGAMVWIASKVVGAGVAFASAMVIVTYSQFPRIVETILNAIQGLVLQPESITSRYSVQIGPARFLDPHANPFLLSVLGGLDLFTIWVVVLMAIGISVIAKVSRSTGAIAAILVWFVTLIPSLWQAFQQS